MKMKLWEYLYHLPKAIKAAILYGPRLRLGLFGRNDGGKAAKG